MALETATYISSLVVSNPSGDDQKNTADDHIRMMKACLKRTLPLLDGAVSLSHTQLMRLNDVSQSVQFQFNQLRDGSATANNALYSNSAGYAASAGNAIAVNGVAGSDFARTNFANVFTERQVINSGGNLLRFTGGSSDYFSWHNSLQSIRYGYIQMVVGGNLVLNSEQANSQIDLYSPNGVRVVTSSGVGAVWTGVNDGAGSGLDADLLDGYQSSEVANASTVPVRSTNGFLFATYFSQSSGEAENPNVNSVFVSNGDGFHRKATPAYLGTFMTTRNITGKTGVAKTLSASAPSGGNDGDIWYRY